MILTRFLLGFLFLVYPQLAHGRAMDFNKESFAVILRGGYGMNQMQRKAYEPGFTDAVSFNDAASNYQYNYEFGLAFTFFSRVTLRAGVEIVSPNDATKVKGNDSTGTNLLSVTSQVFSLVPQGTLEFIFIPGSKARLYGGFGGGYGYTTIKNTVEFTDAGRTLYGLVDYVEEGTAMGVMAQGIFGFEFSLADLATLSLEVGYRQLFAAGFKSTRNSQTPIGTVNTNDVLKTREGTDRTVNLSGPFASVGLRFYFF